MDIKTKLQKTRLFIYSYDQSQNICFFKEYFADYEIKSS